MRCGLCHFPLGLDRRHMARCVYEFAFHDGEIVYDQSPPWHWYWSPHG